MGETTGTDRLAGVPVDVGRPGIAFRRGEQVVGAAPASRRCRSVIDGRVGAGLLESWTERVPLSGLGQGSEARHHEHAYHWSPNK